MVFDGIRDTMLFPYNEGMINIVKFRENLPFNIKSIVSFKSWGYTGRDPLLVNGSTPSGYIVGSDFDSEIDKVDTVVLGSFCKYYGSKDICEKYVAKVLEKGKNIIFLEHEYNFDVNKYKKAFEQIGKRFVEFTTADINRNNIQIVNVPVIGVFGMAEDCGKTQLQLTIAMGLREKGYKVALLGPDTQNALFGGHIYPDCLYSSNMGELEKAKTVRAYANEIVNSENADILIMSAPYGVNRFEDWEMDYRKNGLLSYIIMDAVKPDANFICINTGKDYRHALTNKKTIESITCAPVLALSSRRVNRRFIQNDEIHSDFTIKAGYMNDEMFMEIRKLYETHFDTLLLDQDYIKPSEAAELIMDKLDVQKRFAGAI